jgi:hypothetical protein
MQDDKLDALLGRIEQIAKAVNSFNSEAVQKQAFDALLSAFHGNASTRNLKPVNDEVKDGQGTSEAAPAAAPGRTTKRSSTKPKREAATPRASGGLVRDLNLRPTGKQSFDEFNAEKKPRDNQEKFLLAIYYLEQVAEVQPVTAAHVATVFRMTSGWREPGNLGSGLRMTAHRKNTIDTSDLDNLKTTPHGRNFVEHDLPRKSAK